MEFWKKNYKIMIDAIKFLNKYLEMEPNAEDVDFVLELIREIRDKINQ